MSQLVIYQLCRLVAAVKPEFEALRNTIQQPRRSSTIQRKFYASGADTDTLMGSNMFMIFATGSLAHYAYRVIRTIYSIAHEYVRYTRLCRANDLLKQ